MVVFFCSADVGEGLQVAQLQGHGLGGRESGGIFYSFPGGIEFALGVEDLPFFLFGNAWPWRAASDYCMIDLLDFDGNYFLLMLKGFCASGQ